MQVVSHPFTHWSVTHQGVFDSLNHTGFTYEQTTDVFGKVGSEKWGELLQQLDPLLQQTLDHESVAYFADGVHPASNAQII